MDSESPDVAFTDLLLDAPKMSKIRDEVHSILESDNPKPSLFYWNRILHYAAEHHTLTSLELDVLCEESERCREFWNEQGLQIQKEDVSPKIR